MLVAFVSFGFSQFLQNIRLTSFDLDINKEGRTHDE